MAIEAAMVSMLLFTILAGIVDLSTFFRTSYQVNTAARAAARTAASDPMASTFASGAAAQVASALKGTDPARVTKIWVYKASTATGQPVSGAACSSQCVRFTLDGSGNVNGSTGAWSNRSACAGGTVDAVGVLVEYRYNAPIVFFDEGLITDRTVMRLEQVSSTSTCVSS
ncbi:pilus assembly protein [Phycicoccus sp. CSK15P-2]|uniref:TadE/TadG family type IV pilus assembly protein n=1 Tax=Phycicoccus sp. CSK15P-2 TaxID=2807627 RepID=UPI0019520C6E|nr:TadE/TadG family type IV pilus assembly protein [Phycicoccus sp. CSK15P-2]MBM6405946.1 pilus assembly protein [Phycicoccus sp. CSK15P-2]